MSTVIAAYRPGRWRRICDICARWRTAPDHFISTSDNVWICNYHPGMVSTQELDRRNARERPPRVIPVPNAKPRDPRDTWTNEEAAILNLIQEVAPYETRSRTSGGSGITGSQSVQAAGWACEYLYQLITEAERPKHWTTAAKAKLASLADWLLTQLMDGPTTGGTDDLVTWGAFNRATGSDEETWTEDSAIGGLALLRAYQVHGTATYLSGARACAWFLRGAQCGDKLSSLASSTDAAGSSTKHFGMWTHRIRLNGAAYEFDHLYYPGDLIGLEFLNAFKTEAGDETIGSSTSTAPFNASRAALVSTAISEAKAFWADGAHDVTVGSVVTGLSSTTPREYFSAYPSDKGTHWDAGTGSWEFQDAGASTGTLVTSRGFAVALRAIHAVDGATSQVTTIFDWLKTFTSNSTYEFTYTEFSPVDDREREYLKRVSGVYNAKLAPSTLLLVRSGSPLAAAKQNGSSVYDWASLGLLSALYSSRDQTNFRTAKETANTREWTSYDPMDARVLFLGTLGQSGLNLQPYTDASLNREESVTRAAMFGLMYRQNPQAHVGRFA